MGTYPGMQCGAVAVGACLRGYIYTYITVYIYILIFMFIVLGNGGGEGGGGLCRLRICIKSGYK